MDPFLTDPDNLNMRILSLLSQGSFVRNFVVIRNIHLIFVFLLNDIMDILDIEYLRLFYTFLKLLDQMRANGEERRSRFDGLQTIISDFHFVMKIFQRFKTQT